nr:hypothetical protein CFP56_35619 [Quercus suber]
MSTRERSTEEEDTLERSTKEFKDDHSKGEGSGEGLGQDDRFGHLQGSYKERLVGAIPGAYVQAFGFESAMEEEIESDEEEDDLCEGMTALKLSKEEKRRIREPWGQSIIVKTFGRNVGYMFLSSRLRTMWKPVGRMDIIDLEHGHFLIKFELKPDLDEVLKGGPWFVVAVWLRLPDLPIEFYEPTILKKIGNTIGPVLKIDSHTFNGERGRFARICIQTNVEKPLIKTVKIGKVVQAVQYEGINDICFACGRIGHKKEGCSTIIKGPETPPVGSEQQQNPSVDLNGSQDCGQRDVEVSERNGTEEYGDWMVVKRKHKPKENRGSSHKLPSEATGRDGKRKSYADEGRREVRLVQSQPNQSHKNYASSKSKKDDMGLSMSGPKKLSQDRNSLGWGFDTWPTNSKHNHNPSEGKLSPLSQKFHFGAGVKGNGDYNGKMCDFSQRESHSNRRQDNRKYSERSNRHHGLVRGGSNGGVEKHFSIDRAPNKQSTHTAREAILDAPLRKITECFGKDSSRTSDYTKESITGSANRDGGNGKLISAQTPLILEAVGSMHTEHSEQPSSIRDSEACCESLSECDQGVERAAASIEIEGDRGGTIPNVL